MLFDLTANTRARKLMVLNPNYPEDVTRTVIKGDTTSATFKVVISEPGKPDEYTYQWYVDGSPVAGATNSTYMKSGLSTTATYSIFCRVTNKKGSVDSRTAKLEVSQYYAPVLNSSYPLDATVELNNSVTSNVMISAAGNPDSYTYQWYKNGSAVSGAIGTSYTFTPDAIGTTTVYCKVTNEAGSVNSRTATITATPYYIFNDGVFPNGGWYGYDGDDGEDYVEMKNGILHLYDQSTGYCVFYTTEKYDFTGRNKLYFYCPSASTNNEGANTFIFGASNVQDGKEFAASISMGSYNDTSGKTFEVDVSSLTGSYYIKFGTIRTTYHNDDIYVERIYFG